MRFPAQAALFAATLSLVLGLPGSAALWATAQQTAVSDPFTDPEPQSEMPADAQEDRTQKAAAADETEGPVEYRIRKPEEVPPALPEGIDGIVAPALVIEPAVTYRPGHNSELGDSLILTEIPEPARPGPRAMAAVDRVSGFDSQGSEPAGSVPATTVPGAPSLETSFAGTVFDDNAANTGFVFIPPDPIGAAGPNHVISVVNVTIQFYTKAGTPLLDSTPGPPITGVSLQSFFAPLAPVNFTFDPKVLYDQYAGRFVVMTMERVDTGGAIGNSSRLLVAVSDDSDPTGTWYFTAINSLVNIGGLDRWADYPGFAIDEEAVYITANMFAFTFGGFGFGGTRLWVIDKDAGSGGGFYGGGSATAFLIDPYGASPNCLTTQPFCSTTQPAHTFGSPPPSSPTDVGTWLTLYSGLTGGGDEFLQVMRIDDPTTGSPSLVGPSFINLGNLENLSGAIPDAPQLDTATAIETNDRRILDSVWRGNHLYATTTIDPRTGPDAGQATAHWIELDTSVLGSPSLIDQGSISGNDIADQPGEPAAAKSTFFPSIAVNSSNHIAVGFAASGPSIYAGSFYTTILPGTAPKPDTGSGTLKRGTDYYIRTFGAGRNRWGDYSGMALDPVDQCFWVYNEHAMGRGTPTSGGEDGRWATEFGKFCTGVANTPPVANDDGFVTVQNTPLSVPAPGVLANDTDADGDPLTAILVSDVSNGVLSLASNGSFTYTPNAPFLGVDSFTYKANDSAADSNVATVQIAVVATCPSALNLSGITIASPLTLEASSQIRLSTVTIEGTGNLKLVAPLVIFDSGLEALAGSQLEVENGTCP